VAFKRATAAKGLNTKGRIVSPTEPTKITRFYKMPTMSRLPNQISSERADLLVQIARCRRLAKEVTDPETVRQLLALAVEYEQKLARQQ
jgi:hypothetical protein